MLINLYCNYKPNCKKINKQLKANKFAIKDLVRGHLFICMLL